jgi:hypothetical protein
MKIQNLMSLQIAQDYFADIDVLLLDDLRNEHRQSVTDLLTNFGESASEDDE